MKSTCLTKLSIALLVGFLGCHNALGQSLSPAVFVTNNVGDSITSFTLNSDGSLNFVGLTPTTEGPQCISLTPNGRFLAVGHGTQSSTFEDLIVFEVGHDATLTQRTIRTTPDSPLDCQWISDTHLAVTETSLSNVNRVIIYEWDEINNTLTEIESAGTGTFNSSLAVSFERSLLFANDTFGDTVYSFSFNSAGLLKPNDAQPTGDVFPVAVATSLDGNFVYAAGGISGTGNEILGFSVDSFGGIDPIAGAQSPGESPKVIGINDAGTVLVAGHGSDSTVQSFSRDPSTGLIAANGFSFDVGSQGNLGDLVVMGDMMFVTDESTFDNGVRGLYSFRINPDGSFTQLGPIVDTQGTRPEYIAAWPGVEPDIVAPTSFVVTQGVLTGGGLSELSVSDDLDLALQRNVTSFAAVNEIEIKATSSTEMPSRFDFTLEASVFARSSVTQSIALFNYSTGAYEVVDQRPANRFSDVTVVVSPTGDLARFVEPGTRCIEARITFASSAQRQNFATNIDLTQWTIE